MIIIAQVIGGILGCISAWASQVTVEGVDGIKPGLATLAPSQPDGNW